MATALITIENQKEAKLTWPDGRAFKTALKACSYEVPGWRFTPAGKAGRWDGKISLMSKFNSKFPVGLVGVVSRELQAAGYEVAVRREADGSGMGREISDLLDSALIKSVLWRPENRVVLRDYQVKAIQAILKHHRGIVQFPTGGGKTLAAAGLTELAIRHGLTVLFLVGKRELLFQTRDVYQSVGIGADVIGDGRWCPGQVNVGMVQTLAMGFPKYEEDKLTGKKILKRAAKKEVIDFLKGVDVLIVDEAHNGSSESMQTVIDGCENARYRVGLTATPLMKGAMEDLKLQAVTGDIIYRVTLQDMIDRGLLAQPYVKFVRISKPMLNQKLPWQRAYKLGVVENGDRNWSVVEETVDLVKLGKSVLLLVNNIQHGHTLHHMMTGRLPLIHPDRVAYIHGSKDTEERARAIERIKAGELDVLISSTIADEGLDIPAVGAVVLAGGWKSAIRLYQRIGRGMRRKEGDNTVFVVDFVDLTNKHLAGHSLARYKLVRAEPAFRVVESFSEVSRAA